MRRIIIFLSLVLFSLFGYGQGNYLFKNGAIVRFNGRTIVYFDSDASAFLDSAGITNSVQRNAINNLVIDLKAINNLEPNYVNFDNPENSKCIAIYPFIGSTADNHKWNLINPQNTDAAHRLTYGAGITQTDYGIDGSGASGSWANPHINTSALGTYYHGFDVFMTGGYEGAVKYSITGIFSTTYMYCSSGADTTANSLSRIASLNQFTSLPSGIISNNTYSNSGLWQLNRTGNGIGDMTVYINGTKQTGGTSITNSDGASAVYLLALTTTTGNANTGLSFAVIRDTNVSDTAIKLTKNAIYKYLHALDRLSDKNLVFEGHSFFTNPGTNYSDHIPERTTTKLNTSYSNRVFASINSSLGGSTIQNLIDRKSTHVDPFYESRYDVKNIIPIWIGTNDITSTVGSGTTAYNSFVTYYNSVVNDGWIPIVFTMTPKVLSAQAEIERNTFNNLIRNTLSPTYLIDTDLISESLDPEDTNYYSDGIHPTATLNKIFSIYLYNEILSIP